MKLKALLALMISLALSLSACSSRELNTFSLLTALGIDKDENGYMMTYQVLNPKALASKKSVSESPFFLYSEKGGNFDEINKRIIAQSARSMYASHVRAIVIGEDLARNGLRELMDYLFRNNEYRTDYYFIIAKGTTANQILSTITQIESVSGMKLYESIENSKKQWAMTTSIKLIELINEINSKGNNPVMAGVEFYQESEKMDSLETLEKSNAGKIKFAAQGAFLDDKLVGWLDESDSIAYANIIYKGKIIPSYIDYDENTRVSLNIVTDKAKIKVSLSDGKPVVDVTIPATMRITTETGNVDFTNQENLEKLKRMADEKMLDQCQRMLDKVQHEFKADIFGFGENIHRAYPKVWKELKDNWDEEFTTLQVNFKADSQLLNFGENLKSVISEKE